jgi:hypothetical protein
VSIDQGLLRLVGHPFRTAVVELPVATQARDGRHFSYQIGTINAFRAMLAQETRQQPHQWHAVGPASL